MQKEIVQVDVRAVAININQSYRPELSADELYDHTRGVWRLHRDRAEKAKYAFAVYDGEILEAYEIFKWVRADTTDYITGRQFTDDHRKFRFEFVGKVANEDIRERFVGKLLPEKHSQNPIRYYKV
jgi:hypothetical protein